MHQDTYEAAATVTAGKLTLSDPAGFKAALRRFADGDVIVRVERARSKRSLDQNRLYWKAYVEPFSEYTGYPAEWVHAFYKKRFLPMAGHMLIQDGAGEVIEEVDVELTTTKLSKQEFTAYLDRISAWIADTFHGEVTVGSMREAA